MKRIHMNHEAAAPANKRGECNYSRRPNALFTDDYREVTCRECRHLYDCDNEHRDTHPHGEFCDDSSCLLCNACAKCGKLSVCCSCLCANCQREVAVAEVTP
jgi:hypothetical protein